MNQDYYCRFCCCKVCPVCEKNYHHCEKNSCNKYYLISIEIKGMYCTGCLTLYLSQGNNDYKEYESNKVIIYIYILYICC